MNKVFIIAEAGVNHNGERDLAFELIDVAVASGADAVKFQTFKTENLVTTEAVKADYQQRTTGSEETQFAMLKRLELGYQLHHDLNSYCNKNGISFLSTAFDEDSLQFLVDEIDLSILKIPSGELTNGPFLLKHARVGKPIVLSTGMATLREVEEALAVISFGLLRLDETPGQEMFSKALQSKAGQAMLKEKVTLLHCTTDYPANNAEINLLAMKSMGELFNLPVGYSDHSKGGFVPPLAVALGATVIEKHFTLDKSLPGPDHKASLEPHELKDMVLNIRLAEEVLGDGKKRPTPREIDNRLVVRKSLVAAAPIRAGDVFSLTNLSAKRPGTGISPMKFWEMLGESANKSFEIDEVIS